MWGFRAGALSHPRPLVLSGVRLRPTTHWLWVRGLQAWGPVTNPTARALVSWLSALSRQHEEGAPLASVWGIRGRAPSHPRPPVCSVVRPGPADHWLWVRGLRARGPVTNPTARALTSWLCALWGRHVGARGGRLLPGCGASGVGRSPTPDLSSARACNRGPLPTGCGCGGSGRGDLAPTRQCALLRAGFARCGGGMRAHREGATRLCVGRPGSGDLPPPTTRPFKRVAGAHYPFAFAAVGLGVGTRHQTHSARSWELALPAVGAARGRPGGAPLAWVSGVRGRAPPHPRPLVLFGPAARARFPLAVGAAFGRGGPVVLGTFPVLRVVVCCAPFPGSRHPVAVVAWHLTLCHD